MAIPARRFLPWDLLAAAIWAVASVLLGYFAALDFERALAFVNRSSLILLAAALVVAAVAFWVRASGRARRRAGRS